MPIIGVPKTIDNNLSTTDNTFGFYTAVTAAMEALDKLKTTAESHDRVMILEVMGRDAGWIALASGLAAGAHAILVRDGGRQMCVYAAYAPRVGGDIALGLIPIAAIGHDALETRSKSPRRGLFDPARRRGMLGKMTLFPSWGRLAPN